MSNKLIDTYARGVREAMDVAHARDGFASNGSAESITAGLEAVAEAARAEEREKAAQIAEEMYIAFEGGIADRNAKRIAARIREQGKEQGS